MNKRQKAIAQAVPGKTMSASEFEYATDNYKEFRKSRKMTNTQFKEYRDTISEGKFSKSLIAKAIKIAKKSSGNMTAAFNAIEKLKKGLGDDPEVSDALRLANESKKSDKEENDLLDKEAIPHMKEAMLRDRDWTYDEKEGVVKISKKNFAKVKKDHKGTDKKNPTMMVLTKKGTSLVPVKFTEALEYGTDETCKEYKKKTPGEANEDIIIDEGLKMDDPKLNKIFDKLKKGMKVKFKISSTIAKGKEFTEYMVTAKNTVNKGKVEKITLVTKDNPKAVKKFLYRRDGKVTFAIGDMGASIDDVKESRFQSFAQFNENVYDPKDADKWIKDIQKGINAPVVQATKSTLGGEERMSIMIKFSMEKEAAKGGTSWHNSNHANLRVDRDGSMEMFQRKHTMGKALRKSKIKSSKDVIKKINDWIAKMPELKEEVLAEAYKYKVDHKTYTSAVEEALVVAEKAKYEVDMDDYFNSIATGPRKPGEGKTNTFKIALTKNGKEQRKRLQIQIYGKGKHGYELNCYIS